MSAKNNKNKTFIILIVLIVTNILMALGLIVAFVRINDINWAAEQNVRTASEHQLDYTAFRIRLDEAGIFPSRTINENFCRNGVMESDGLATRQACETLLAELDGTPTDDNNEQ